MAAETISSSLTEIVNSEAISRVIIEASRNVAVTSQLCAFMDLTGMSTGTASFPQWELDAVSAITTEGTSTLSNVELQTTEVGAIATSTVGILREVTKRAEDLNMLGAAGLIDYIERDGANLCVLDLENSLVSRFSGFSTSVGTSGQDMSVANFVEARSRMDTLNAHGPKAAVVDDQQAFDLRAAVAASTGVVFSDPSLQNLFKDQIPGSVGTLFGVPTFVTNLTDTANTGDDVVGAMFINGRAAPNYAAIAYAAIGLPKVMMSPSPSEVADLIAIYWDYGTGRVSNYGVQIVTDA